MIEMLAVQVAEREMREVEIFHIPDGSMSRITADRLAEKRQFESVTMATRGFQIPRVVPPFRLKVRVIVIVSREFESITGHRRAVLRGQRVENQKRRSQGGELTLHGQPQAD